MANTSKLHILCWQADPEKNPKIAKQTPSWHPLSGVQRTFCLFPWDTDCLWPGLPFYQSSRLQRALKICKPMQSVFLYFWSLLLCAKRTRTCVVLCVKHAIFIDIACYDDQVVRATHRRFGMEIPPSIFRLWIRQTPWDTIQDTLTTATIKVNNEEITCKLRREITAITGGVWNTLFEMWHQMCQSISGCNL